MWHSERMQARSRRDRGPIVGVAVIVTGVALAGLAAAAGVAGAKPGPRLVLAPLSGPVGTSVSVRGSGFRPRAGGIVVFGTRRVAAFRASGRGSFLVAFVVRAGDSGQVPLTAEQVARNRHGSVRRLKRARVRFRVLTRSSGGGVRTGGRWAPPRHLTWYWQLQGSINNSQPVAAYDIDGFNSSAGEVSALHAQGKHVICYIDVGTTESWRPDQSSFPASVMGGSNGWPGEKWLDISKLSVLQPIMTARFQMCREKGFDAVEPDNMDGYENKTGFPLTSQQQLEFNEWIAGKVHSLGMAVFQKNDGEQTSQLRPHFDGAIDEQCNQYNECSKFQPYLAVGKPVLNAEYNQPTSSFCAADNAAGIMGARYGLGLNGTTFEPCW